MGLFKKTLFVGSLIGLGMLLAPKDGKTLRKGLKENYDAKLAPIIKDLNKKASDLYKQTRQIDSDEVKANLRKKIDDVQESLKNLSAKSAGKATVNGIKKASTTLATVAKDIAQSPKTKEIAKKTAKAAVDVVDKAAHAAHAGAKKVVEAARKDKEQVDLFEDEEELDAEVEVVEADVKTTKAKAKVKVTEKE